jgi:uncharacterized protein
LNATLEFSANGLTVNWFDAAADIGPELWRACFPAPLEGFWWYDALDRAALDDQFTFAYGVVYQAEKAVAIAPVFQMRLPVDLIAPPAVAKLLVRASPWLDGLRFQKTLFVGSPCADEGTVGVVPGTSIASILPGLTAAIEQRAAHAGCAMVVWKDFVPTDTQALHAADPNRGYFNVCGYPGTHMRLPEGGFDAYLAGLTGNQRHNFRKKIRRSRQTLPLSASVVDNVDAPLLNHILMLFQQTYEKSEVKFERLGRAFWEQICARSESRVIVLREETTNTPVAFMLVFKAGHRLINKFIGIDYARPADSYLYFRLFEEFIRLAYAEGATEVSSGQTGYRPKLDLGHTLVPLTHMARHRNPLLHWAFGRLAADITWASLDDDLRRFEDSRRGKALLAGS